MVSLTGSDFTGLGIEITGGLKEGIFVKKVSSRGPASGIVNIGDRITSLTIDFRHIVQEDAISILSYASPYNVQLEVIDGKGHLPVLSSSPKDNQSPLSHPLYRSSSQDNFDTIERNSRKKLFPNDDSNYPTLKMDGSSSPTSHNVTTKVHKENEKEKKNSFKQQIKNLVEEKLQNRSTSPEKTTVSHVEEKSPTEKKNHGMKFGIRVLPPNVNEKLFGKSPTKVDNENNQNLENSEKTSPPQAMKRNSKDKTSESSPAPHLSPEFQRHGSINSSGIKRDAAGIPQELPNHMMNAAMAAKDNRKSSGNTLESKKSKGKAPKPPPTGDDMNASTTTTDTHFDVSIDQPDGKEKTTISDKMNFSDNFVDQIIEKNRGLFDLDKIEPEGMSNNSTPKSDRRKHASDTESQLAMRDESDHEDDGMNKNKISLDSNHITVHQASEEESGDEGRRAASLGDLSKYDSKSKSGIESRSNQGTLERAQSLEMSDQGGLQLHGSSNKRKATISDTDLVVDSKEPRLMDLVDNGMDTLQRGRLKSAYEFGTLQDALNDDNQSLNKDKPLLDDEDDKAFEDEKDKHADMVKEVMAVADKFNKELEKEIVAVMENVNQNGVIQDSNTTNIIVNDNHHNEEIKQNGDIHGHILTTKNNDEVTVSRFDVHSDEETSLDNSEVLEIHREPLVLNGGYREERITISPISFNLPTNQTNGPDPPREHTNATDHVKIINFGTNVPDDIKVSRYPFGSLERPKSDVLKKLMEIQNQDNKTPTTTTSTITSTTTKIESDPNLYLDTQPISLTFIGNGSVNHDHESDLTESSQISPVYSSDNQGVNSISISAMEIQPESNIKIEKHDPSITRSIGMDNIVTISTESSQPSSIILIDDEKLDFTLQTPVEPEIETNIKNNHKSISDDDVFEDSVQNNIDNKTFVTEITVKSTSHEDLLKIDTTPSNDSVKIVSAQQHPPTPPKPVSSEIKSQLTSSLTNFMAQEKQHVEDNFIPRNSEIRFTTSTYESNKVEQPKRLSQIDQIRSNFELKNNQHSTSSEIPIPVRKSTGSSIPILKSPSKIPVFNSFSSSNSSANLKQSPSPPNEHHVTTTTAQLVQPKTSPTNNNNRVSVTVTSIKNLSKNPSGKFN